MSKRVAVLRAEVCTNVPSSRPQALAYTVEANQHSFLCFMALKRMNNLRLVLVICSGVSHTPIVITSSQYTSFPRVKMTSEPCIICNNHTGSE